MLTHELKLLYPLNCEQRLGFLAYWWPCRKMARAVIVTWRNCCLPTMCARALLTLLLLKYCCEHERPNESCSYWMVLFPMECCLYPVVNGAFLPCRAVAMSCGISGILLAKKSIDRQRLKLLHEKNRETYANRWHITLFIKSLCDFDDMTVYTHLHVYQSQIWFYYNIICMSLIRCIILFINITE